MSCHIVLTEGLGLLGRTADHGQIGTDEVLELSPLSNSSYA